MLFFRLFKRLKRVSPENAGDHPRRDSMSKNGTANRPLSQVFSWISGRPAFRRAAPTFLISCIAGILGFMALISNLLFSGQAAKMEEAQFKLVATTVDFNVQNLQQRAALAADAISNIASIKRLHAAKNREGLLDELEKSYSVLKEKYAVDQIQLHTLPATSLLRVQAPDKFGDDLTLTRPGVVAVNRDKQAVSAPTMTRTGFAVLGIVPAYDEAGKHIGSLEVGIVFNQFIARLKESYGFDSVVLADGEAFKKSVTAWSDQSIFADENRIGNFLNFRSTDWKKMKALVTTQDIQELKDDTVTYAREEFGSTYGVVLYPLRNAAGVRIGIVAAATDISGPRQAQTMFTVVQITLTVLGIILSSGAVMLVIRGFLLGPLAEISEGFRRLSDGDSSAVPIDADTYCAEIQELNGHLNALRARK